MKKFNQIDQLITSPQHIEELIRLISLESSSGVDTVSKAGDAERIADLLTQVESEVSTSEVGALDKFVNGRSEPCLLVSHAGEILGANNPARTLFGAASGQALDELGILSINGELLGPQVANLAAASALESRYRTGRVHYANVAQSIPIVMVTVPGSNQDQLSDVLILLGDAPDLYGRYAQSYRDHNLSRSEIAVVEQFITGMSLSDIAEARGRSVATVRKQFYTICEKFGVTSQAELLRAIYQDASIVADIGEVIEQTQHPDRIEASILRPGGRMVEVVVAGDKQGYPLLLLPSPSLRAWPAASERMFKNAGVQIITILGPGFGKTSHPHQGESRIESGATDAIAVMDQLGLHKALIVSSNFGLRTALSIANAAPERFSGIVMQSLSIPPAELRDGRSSIGILANIQSILGKSMNLSDLAVRAASRSFQAMSPRVAVRMLHRGNPKTIASLLDPENYPEVAAAVGSVFEQGADAATEAFLASQDDWSEEIRSSHVPITLVAGVGSDLHKLSDLRDFADRYSANIRFRDVSEQQLHSPYDLVALLIALVNEYRDVAAS